MSPAVEQRYEKRIVHDYFVRFHMTLILSAVIASGVLTSKGLLTAGVLSLRVRYPLAVLASYLVFLGMVRIWIWYVSTRKSLSLGCFDPGSGTGGSGGSWSIGGGGSSGGGGGFGGFGGGSSGGGGASASWDSDLPAMAVSGSNSGSAGSSGWLPKFDFDFDLDDGGWILILLAVLAIAILGAGGYLVYTAPHILPEAAFQAVLAGSLKRAAKQPHNGWVRGVLRSTWIPFTVVLILATVLGWEAHKYCPAAPRLIDVFHCATRGS